MVVVGGEGIDDAAEVGAEYLGELACHFEVVATAEGEAQVKRGAEDAVDGFAELPSEINSGVEVTNESVTSGAWPRAWSGAKPRAAPGEMVAPGLG
jgi:hypothetical protein